jgi:hypothetical protein
MADSIQYAKAAAAAAGDDSDLDLQRAVATWVQ